MASMDLETALKYCKDEAEETRLRCLYNRVEKCRKKINDVKKDKDKFQSDIVSLQSRFLSRDKIEVSFYLGAIIIHLIELWDYGPYFWQKDIK